MQVRSATFRKLCAGLAQASGRFGFLLCVLIAFQVSGFAFTWISKPAYDSVFPAGTNVLLEAYVEIPVERVEFFVDGLFVGSDDTPPYQANYIAVAGNHNATAVSVTQSGFRDEAQ